MKFIKHFTDAHEGRSLLHLFDKFGHAGPCCYWILVELCGKKLEKKQDEEFTEDDCVFVFHERVLREKFRLSRAKVEHWLNYGSTLDLFSFEVSENEIKIVMPKLLESLDRDAKRARRKRDDGAAPPGQDKEEDKDKDKELSLLRGGLQLQGEDSQENKLLPETPGQIPEPDSPPDPSPPLPFGPRELAIAWNERMADVKSAKGQLMLLVDLGRFRPGQRRWATAERKLREDPDRSLWIEAIDRMARSRFCRGFETKGDWVATFDFLLEEGRLTQILEGQFGCKPRVEPHDRSPQAPAADELIDEGPDADPELVKLICLANFHKGTPWAQIKSQISERVCSAVEQVGGWDAVKASPIEVIKERLAEVLSRPSACHGDGAVRALQVHAIVSDLAGSKSMIEPERKQGGLA